MPIIFRLSRRQIVRPGDLVSVRWRDGEDVSGIIIRGVDVERDSFVLSKFYDWWVLVEGEIVAFPKRVLKVIDGR